MKKYLALLFLFVSSLAYGQVAATISCGGTGDVGPCATTLNASTFTKLALNTVYVDTNLGWNATTNVWTVPVTGTYQITTKTRIQDGSSINTNFGSGIAINGANTDSSNFVWSGIAAYRTTVVDTRSISLTQGQTINLFAYCDLVCKISSASINIVQLNSSSGGGSGGTSFPSGNGIVKVTNGNPSLATGDSDYTTPTGLSTAIANERTTAANASNLTNGAVAVGRLPAVSNSSAGIVPSLPNDSTKFFNGVGAWVAPLALKINGTPNGLQSVLNLIAGTNITLSDNGSGGITVNATSSGAGSSSPATTSAYGTVQLGPNATTSVLSNIATSGKADDLAGTVPASVEPLLGTNTINITVAPYYGSPNGSIITTTTAAVSSGATTIPVGSCATFVAGNGFIAGASAINKVSSCTGTTLTATTGLSTSLASGATVQHDETTAIQTAVTSFATTGGKILFPYGVYLVNGPLQDTSGANAIIDLPSKTANANGQPPLLIEFQGVRRTSQGNNYQSSTILTNAQNGSLLGGYNSGGSIPGFTNFHVSLSNLNFNVQSSNDTSNLRMIDGRHFMGLQTDHIWVGGGGDKIATGSSVGIAEPLILNNVENVVSDTWVTGFASNYIFTEHTHIREAYSLFSPNCFVFDNGSQSVFANYTGNSISGDYIWAQTCSRGIVTNSNLTPVHINVADIESTDTMIYDPNNNLRGYIGILQPYAPYTISQNGALNVSIYDIAHSTFLKLNANVLVGGNVNNTSNFTPLTNGNVFNVSGASTLGIGNVGQMITLINGTGTAQTVTPVNGATINGSTNGFSMDAYHRSIFVVNPTSQNDWDVVVY